MPAIDLRSWVDLTPFITEARAGDEYQCPVCGWVGYDPAIDDDMASFTGHLCANCGQHWASSATDDAPDVLVDAARLAAPRHPGGIAAAPQPLDVTTTIHVSPSEENP